MDDKGRFIYTKPEPVEGDTQGKNQSGDSEGIARDPYAGTDIDQQHLGQMMADGGKPTMEEAGQPAEVKSEGKPQKNPNPTKNKARLSVGPDKRFSGLPSEAGNKNVDKRTERRTR